MSAVTARIAIMKPPARREKPCCSKNRATSVVGEESERMCRPVRGRQAKKVLALCKHRLASSSRLGRLDASPNCEAEP